MTHSSPMLDWGREILGVLPVAEGREWLVTNGLGGFASGTVAGLLTRRYHGLLVAPLQPPLGRTLLVAKLEETVEREGAARAFLDPMAQHLADHGVGSLAELFDGDPPFTPRGCIAQAWSVAETLRAWLAVGAVDPAPNGQAGRHGATPA